MRSGFGLGYLIRSSVLEVVEGRWKRGMLRLLILRKSLLVLPILMFISFVANVTKSRDTVDRGSWIGF